MIIYQYGVVNVAVVLQVGDLGGEEHQDYRCSSL